LKRKMTINKMILEQPIEQNIGPPDDIDEESDTNPFFTDSVQHDETFFMDTDQILNTIIEPVHIQLKLSEIFFNYNTQLLEPILEEIRTLFDNELIDFNNRFAMFYRSECVQILEPIFKSIIRKFCENHGIDFDCSVLHFN
jgi:hypothetical protein